MSQERQPNLTVWLQSAASLYDREALAEEVLPLLRDVADFRRGRLTFEDLQQRLMAAVERVADASPNPNWN